MTTPRQAAPRIQANLLASAERRLLLALCRRLPAFVTPDMLTLTGLAGAVVVAAGYVLSRTAPAFLWLGAFGYAIHWFGDSLDGSLARHRRIERPRYGGYVDHATDALGNFIGMAGLGCTRFVRMDVALFALVGYLLLTLHVVLRLRATGTMQLSFVGGGPTELRLGLVVLTLAMWWFGGWPVMPDLSIYDLGVGIAGAVFLAIFLGQLAATARLLRAAGD